VGGSHKHDSRQYCPVLSTGRLSFWNNEVLGSTDGVLEVVRAALRGVPPPQTTPPPKGGGNKQERSARPALRSPRHRTG
jgi:hypothetical protein